MISQEFIIAAADKSILKISGIHVRGLNTQDLERRLSERLHTLVRVIGVTGEQIEMDVYGIDPAQIRKDESDLPCGGDQRRRPLSDFCQ